MKQNRNLEACIGLRIMAADAVIIAEILGLFYGAIFRILLRYTRINLERIQDCVFVEVCHATSS